MLALAIISILLVLISKTVRRDTFDQIQADQYEEYYSAVEQELLKIISGQSDCDLETGNNCTNIPLDQLKFSGVLNDNYLNVSAETKDHFENIAIGKDKNLKIPLDGFNGELSFSWKGEVAWVVNIDYQTNSGEYKTSQSIYDKSDIFNPGDPVTCLNFIPEGTNNRFKFDISQCLEGVLFELPGSYTALAVRLKPIMKNGTSTELTLEGHSGGILPPQATVILATAVIDDDLGTSPAIQLELQIPTEDPSLEILDYALRTNKIVYKTQN